MTEAEKLLVDAWLVYGMAEARNYLAAHGWLDKWGALSREGAKAYKEAAQTAASS